MDDKTLRIIELAMETLELYQNWVASEFRMLRMSRKSVSGPWVCTKEDICCMHHQSEFSFLGDVMWNKIGLHWYLKVDFEMFKEDMLKLGLYVNGNKCAPPVFAMNLLSKFEIKSLIQLRVHQ